MQGMPIQLLTPKLNTTSGTKSAASSKNASEIGENSEAIQNGGFEGLLNQLLSATKGESTSANGAGDLLNQSGNEATGESVIIEHFQKNGVEFRPEELNSAIKLASTSTNLDELINSLKHKGPGQVDARLNLESNTEMNIDGNINESQLLQATELPLDDEASTSSPLDFLIREGKSKEFGQVKQFGEKEPMMKQFVSSEDFIGLRKEAKNSKNTIEVKKETAQIENNLKEQDFSNLIGKKINVGEYGVKNNLLNDNLIRSTQDLAFGERKSKIDFDELKNPDLKIASDLSMNKESFIPNVQSLNAQNEQNVGGSEKVLDLSKINSANTTEIIKNISNYIEQNQIMNTDSMDLNVKHEDLGQFKIQVNRNVGANQNAMDLQIVTTTAEGHEFFAKNEIGLIKTLSQAGIQLSDFKLVQGTENTNLAQGDSRQNQNSHSQTAKEFMNSNNGNSQQGSDRRKELWQEARNLQQRFGA